MSHEEESTTINLPNWGIALFLVFLILKLCGTITWSWWWVTAPLWGPVAIAAVIALIVTTTIGSLWFYELVIKDRNKHAK